MDKKSYGNRSKLDLMMIMTSLACKFIIQLHKRLMLHIHNSLQIWSHGTVQNTKPNMYIAYFV